MLIGRIPARLEGSPCKRFLQETEPRHLCAAACVAVLPIFRAGRHTPARVACVDKAEPLRFLSDHRPEPAMQFETPLIPARLVRRYKRFLADMLLDDGTSLTCHCPNTGAMLGCVTPGAQVWLSRSDNPRRKYAHTWELVEADNGSLTGIHTGRANALVAEAMGNGVLAGMSGLQRIQREVRQPGGHSRIDFRLRFADGRADCFLEVKNVTAAVTDGVALFPDAVSERGTRHLRALMQLRAEGHGAMLVFCAQRGDVREVRPADTIDPAYGEALRQAIAAGVTVAALGARVSEQEILLCRPLPVVCP